MESSSKHGEYLVVNNLFDDEQHAWLFYAGNCRWTAIYALRRGNNQYWVEKLRDWQELEIVAAGFALLLDTVGDVNKNGVPEVVVTELFGASGTPPGHRETIEFYEWDASKRAFASDKVIIREDVCYLYQPCDNGWRVETVDKQGFRPIVVNELYATMLQDIEGESVCEVLIIEHVYLWKNAEFVEQKKTLLPPTDERIECQLSWALQALNRNNNLIDVANEIISKSLENWPDAMTDMWGPASRDYFALRLGLSYDMAGREEDALALIQSVAEHPFDPDHEFASQLAASYLDIRLKQGKVNACKEISLLQSESEHKNLPLYAMYVPLAKLREVWGVGAPIWMYGVDPVCDEKFALQAVAQQASRNMTVDEFLTNTGLNPINVQTVYDSDTLTAWLVSLPAQFLSLAKDKDSFERINDQRIWLFTRSAQGFHVAYVDEANQDANLSADDLHLGEDGALVVIQADELNFQRFFIFHIASTGEIQDQLYDFYADGFVTHETSEITTIAGSYSVGHPEIAVYKWNSEQDRLDKKIINFDFPRAQDEAERLIFQEQDFPRAILYINEFLIQAPPEPKVESSCTYSVCDYYPEWYRPYMRYLLALAYEMSGRAEQARDTYFLLWRDYPDNIFGLAAEHRLVLAKS